MDLAVQLSLARPLLEILGCKCYEQKGYEADDIMATLSKWGRERSVRGVEDSLTDYLMLKHTVSLFLSHRLSISLCVYKYIYLSIFLSLSLYVSCFPLSLSLPLSLSYTHTLTLTHTVLYLYVCESGSVCLRERERVRQRQKGRDT